MAVLSCISHAGQKSTSIVSHSPPSLESKWDKIPVGISSSLRHSSSTRSVAISAGTRCSEAVVATIRGHNNNVQKTTCSAVMHNHVETGLYNLPRHRPGQLRNHLLELGPWIKIARCKNTKATHNTIVTFYQPTAEGATFRVLSIGVTDLAAQLALSTTIAAKRRGTTS